MAIDFKTLVVGPLDTNCYLVWDTDSLEAALIDPGADMELIEEDISRLGLKIKHVLLTHGHPDHCFFAARAAETYSCGVAMHKSDMDQPELLLVLLEMLYDTSNYATFSPSHFLNDGDVLDLGKSLIEVIHTPGHSPGGLCFVTSVGVFCGDTIFAGSVGRTDFAGGSYDQLISTIRERILTLKDDTPLYPGHGPATTVGRERASNPFLV